MKYNALTTTYTPELTAMIRSYTTLLQELNTQTYTGWSSANKLNLQNKVPRVPKNLTNEVPKCPLSARVPKCWNAQMSVCPSAQVPWLPECPSALWLSQCVKYSSAQVPKCLESFSVQVPFFECSMSKQYLQHYKKWTR